VDDGADRLMLRCEFSSHVIGFRSEYGISIANVCCKRVPRFRSAAIQIFGGIALVCLRFTRLAEDAMHQRERIEIIRKEMFSKDGNKHKLVLVDLFMPN
jgi:hypothetical protein